MTSKPIITIPKLVYGTAWKSTSTPSLVSQALHSGFRGFDTAAQPKHYREDLVGAGLRSAASQLSLPREALHIQTKFTSPSGQDLRKGGLPYDPKAPIATQVRESVESSLRNLRMTEEEGEGEEDEGYIDCLILHSPLPTFEATLEAWKAMESFVPSGRVRSLGISNVYQLTLLRRLCEAVEVKPVLLQNRFYPETDFDGEIRGFCREKGMVYQSFWTLTGNPGLLKSGVVGELAEEVGVEREVAVYALVLGLGEGMSVLDGTTREERMRGDLEGLERVERWKEGNGERWEGLRGEFEGMVN